MDEVINPGTGAGIEGGDSVPLEGAVDGNEAVTQPAESAAPAPQPTAEPATAKPETGSEQTVEYVYQGKKFQIPLTKAVLKLQQAHVLDEKFRAVNEKEAQFAAKAAELEAMVGKYKPVDEWANSNPELFGRIVSEFERSQQMQGLPPDLNPEDPVVKANIALAERINRVESMLQEKNKAEQARLKQAEEANAQAMLDQQIAEVRQEYPEINLDATDEAGNRLEAAVIRHGIENHLPFREAFLSLFIKDIVKTAQEKGAKSAAEAIQKKAKLGIVSQGGAARHEAPKASEAGPKSWRQAIDEAVQQYANK